jgi:release factor glutamine methyltransferase
MQSRNPSQTADWTILSLLRWAVSYFTEKDVEGPRSSAELLLAHALGIRRIDLYLQYDRPLLEEELAAFKQLVRRRLDREPVAYILGVREFWSLALTVDPSVLIPRPETECLVEAALAVIKKAPPARPFRVLEMGTGSGAIAIALASQSSHLQLVATDISIPALVRARHNAVRHECADRIAFVCADWFCGLRPADGFDMIISNPPYIPSGEISTLQAEVCGFEPVTALDGGVDGLAAIGRLIHRTPDYLRAQGHLLMEIGHDQRASVEALGLDAGAWEDIHFFRDYSGHHRVTVMRKKELL